MNERPAVTTVDPALDADAPVSALDEPRTIAPDTRYPDLSGPSAPSMETLLPAAEADLNPVLARSRLAPLPPSPTGGTEPAHAAAFLAACRPPVAITATPAPVRRGIPPHEMGVADLLAAFGEGSLTPSSVLAALRRRWADRERVGGAILAEIADTPDLAAAEADERWRTGTARPLEGIPVAVKDIIDVAGNPITSGSHTTGDRVAGADATVVARLKAAGAIPVLITATTEFACGAPNNARYGPVTNPWHRARWTGGSSTGSAAALAARLVPLALGTDTGGSIRIPSAFCNLTGIKPTYGLVPRTGVAALSWTLDHIGPIARSATDLRLVLPHLGGPDDADPVAAPPAVLDAMSAAASSTAPAGELCVGVAAGWFTEACDAGVLAAWESTVDVLRAAGVRVAELDFGDVARMNDDVMLVMTSELASTQEANLDRFELFDIGTQVRIARGFVPSAVDYLRSLRRRVLAQQAAVRAFDNAGVDLVLTPGVGATAARLSDVTVEVNGVRHPMQGVTGRNTGVFDYLGLPAVMAPAGFVDGLPVGVQIVGRPWADESCLRLAELIQSKTPHHRATPN
ncbi:MAG TPA: amidase [Amycolatopsis sp.]|nr:amidase [Amycolatopsis sp.]